MIIGNNEKKLRQQLIGGALGSALIQIVNRALVLVLGVLLARGLGADGYGIYSYAFAILTLMIVIAELGLPTLILRQVASYQSRSEWQYIRGLLLGSIKVGVYFSVIIVTLIAIYLYRVDPGVNTEKSGMIILVALLLPFLVTLKLITAAIQSLQHVLKSQLIDIAKMILVIIGISHIIYFHPEILTARLTVAVQLISTILTLLLAAGLLYRYLPEQVQRKPAQYQSRQWFKSTIPLTAVGIATIIISQTDILMLGYFLRPEEVGIYRVATQAAALVAFGLQAVNSVIAPQLSRLYAQKDTIRLQKILTKSARSALLISLPISIALFFAGGDLAGYVFGPEFERCDSAIAVLTTGQLINISMGSVGVLLNMTGHEKDVARTLFITAGVNIGLNFLLIPPFGIEGAAAATVISTALWNVMLYKVAKIRININSMAFHINKEI